MKIFLLFVPLFLSCNSSDYKVKSNVNKEIVIEYVDLSIQAIARVSCDSYDMAFKNLIKRIVIPEHEKNYKEIYHLVDSLKPFDKQDIDIRVKILFNNKKSKSICMDAFGNFTFSGSDSSFRSEDLLKLIGSLIEVLPIL